MTRSLASRDRRTLAGIHRPEKAPQNRPGVPAETPPDGRRHRFCEAMIGGIRHVLRETSSFVSRGTGSRGVSSLASRCTQDVPHGAFPSDCVLPGGNVLRLSRVRLPVGECRALRRGERRTKRPGANSGTSGRLEDKLSAGVGRFWSPGNQEESKFGQISFACELFVWSAHLKET